MSLELVLASASPRRKELISLLGIPCLVEASRYEEPPAPASPVSLSNLVTSLALEKAMEVACRLQQESTPVVGADTLVTTSPCDIGVPLGKPKSDEDAVRMLRELSGRTHAVFTGIAVVVYTRSGTDALQPLVISRCVRTEVTFRALSDSMITDYVRTREPMDKAGAYGAQGYAAPFIESFSGDFYNVVGLPICCLGKMLEELGFEWQAQRTVLPQIIG